MTMRRLLKQFARVGLMAGLVSSPASAQTVTHLRTDPLGSVVSETDARGNAIEPDRR